MIVVPLLPCLKRSLILTLAKRFLTALDRHRQPDLVAISDADSGRFVEVTEAELTGLHEGNFARYQIRPSEFAAWRKVWEAK